MPLVTWRNMPISENVTVKPKPVTATMKEVIKNRWPPELVQVGRKKDIQMVLKKTS